MNLLLQDQTEAQKALSNIIAKAWSDEEFNAKFLSNTNEVLAENGITVPSGVEFQVRENKLVGILDGTSDNSEGQVAYEISLPTKPTELADQAIHAWNNQNDLFSGVAACKSSI